MRFGRGVRQKTSAGVILRRQRSQVRILSGAPFFSYRRRAGPLFPRQDIEGDGDSYLVGLEWHGAVIEVRREQNHQALDRLDQPDLGLSRGVEVLGRAAEYRYSPITEGA